jgi:eukaryotic-like serine/threonine-protein kinase
MELNRWQKIETVFNATLALPEAERQSFLDTMCEDDPQLRHEIDSLITEVDQPDEFLSSTALTLSAKVLAHEQAESLTGTTLGAYNVLKLLGRGGMGDVFLAEDPRLERLVALKLLPVSLTGDDDRARRFQQEARAASAISHPNVAHIYEFEQAADRDYLVMEYVEGKTLRELLKAKTIDLEQALDIAVQVGQALQAAHEAGVVHRDIKPENIMIRRDGYVKVLDFGLAKIANTREKNPDYQHKLRSSLDTMPGLIMGTTAYMSPDQLRGQAVDHRTDIWSLGVTLYEMLTGVHPFVGQTPSDVSAAVLMREPEDLMLEHLSEEDVSKLQKIVLTALQKDLDRRYASAADFVNELEEVQLSLNQERSTSPIQRDVRTAEQRVEAKPSPARSRTVMIAAAGSIGVIALVLGWFILGARNQSRLSADGSQPGDSKLQKGQAGKLTPPTSSEPPCSAQSPTQGTGRGRTLTLNNGVTLEMLEIPSGSFCRGSPAGIGRINEQPQYRVTVGSYYMGKYEVTQAQWQAVMGNNPSGFKGDNLPVEKVSWDDAASFIARLNMQNDGYTYRLPTEAEWEYACRSGTTTDFAGDPDAIAWYGNNSGRARLDAAAIWRTDSQNYFKRLEEQGGHTHPVGTKLPNAFGLFDMNGNVWEWCQDWYHANYNGAPTDSEAWLSGGDQKSRVLRGGSWNSVTANLRPANRDGLAPDFRSYGLGLRVVAVARTQ